MTAALSLSESEARSLLIAHQIEPGTVGDVFQRLGTVQYDPLNPVGRNPDLVFQARVPGYRVDDWHHEAYHARAAYDAWDKQACLVRIQDWAGRALIRERFHPWHDRQVLSEHPDVVRAAFDTLDSRGPLSSLEFEDRRRATTENSWLGPTIIKRVLRALWARGELVTHHREAGRHYYDRPERVIPTEQLQQPGLTDEQEYYRWVIGRRHQAAGLLRPGASAEVWSVCGDAATRRQTVFQLVEARTLTPVSVGSRGSRYHAWTPALDGAHPVGNPSPRMIFMAPLDNLLWDRRAISELFGFDYIWEVYKRAEDRVWGYYVLPVLYRDRFVARVDSRLEKGVWTILNWWWETDVVPDTEMLDALALASGRFLGYLGARSVRIVSRKVDTRTRSALKAGMRMEGT